ncbi:hypothetical protein WJX82_003759 [Trebouxia sp. C0006]
MEHALKAVQTDNRVRRWKGDADPQWELLYKCSKGQVDWNSPDVLVRHGNWVDQYQVSMAGRTTQEQAAKMSQLAGQALQAWKVEGHPGWSVDTMDSHHLCRLDQQQGPVPQPSLSTYRPKDRQALGAVLGNPLPSSHPGLSDSNSPGSSHEDPLHHSGGPPDGVMTLDEALDSMSPTNFGMGLQNPFKNAAGDDCWEFPASAEGNEGWQEGQRVSSNASATCHESHSGFASLPLPGSTNFEELSLELGMRPCENLEPARKRSKWLPTNKHPSRSPSSASAIQPNSAPGQGCQQRPLIKPQTLTQDDSLITCENMHHAFQGAFPQPWVQHRADRLVELTGLPRDALQSIVRGAIQQTLIAMSPRLNIPQARLLDEFESMFPEPALSESSQQSVQVQRLPVGAQLRFQHDCEHLTCPAENRFCSLCARNPLKRCKPSENFAAKHLETQSLAAPCGASITVALSLGPARQPSSADPGSSQAASFGQHSEDVRLEFSLLNGSIHDSWLQQGHEGVRMDEDIRARCEVLACQRPPPPAEGARKKAPKSSEARPLLEGGHMTQHTPELRVKATVEGGIVSLADFVVQENSETQLGKDVKYKMLVCAIKQDSGKEVAQLVSESFTVTTMRSKGGVKPAIPCLTDPVDKLEGLGGKTRRNLLDVRRCVRNIDARAAVPAAAPNQITTVEHFKQLEEALRDWSSCPKQIRRALLPEPAVEHSQKVLEADSRLRSWRATPESEWGLLYHSSQAFVDFNNPAVLVQPSGGAGGSQFVLAAHASSDQLARMNELAVEALQRWKQADHPGWSVTEADSDTFLARLHQVKAPLTFGGQLEMSEVLQQYPGSHTASSSQELSPQQQQALELDACLGSITGRIHRGHLEHQPSGLFGGQGFASMASLPSGTPGQWGQRAGLMGPPRTALPSPSPSPSPDRLPRLGHALERTTYATPPEQTPSNPAAQFGLGSQPYGDMLPEFPNPFQSYANRPWGQAVEPSTVFESQLVQQPPQESDTEPAPKRPRGPLSSQSQTPNAGPPSPTAQTQTGPTQGITQQPLSQQLLSMTPSTQTQEQPTSPYSLGQTAQPSQGSGLPGDPQTGGLSHPATGTDAHTLGQGSHCHSGQRSQQADEAQTQKAFGESSHSGTLFLDGDHDPPWLMGDASSWDRVFSFPATPPPAADTPHLPPAPDRLSDEGTPLAKRQVRFASDRAVAPGLLQPVLEEGQVSKAEEQQKVAARSNALTSGGSLNLSQELVLRDCCFKWKRGVRNKQSVGSSSTMGGSSRVLLAYML